MNAPDIRVRMDNLKEADGAPRGAALVGFGEYTSSLVLETGAPVLTPWRESINALLEAWYPGEDGGMAIAHVLFGDSDPGGRLPATFPRSEADLPTAPGGAAEYPGTVNSEQECELHFSVPCPYWEETYSEGVFEGYRWYDKQRIEPAFPFGFGLGGYSPKLDTVDGNCGGGPAADGRGCFACLLLGLEQDDREAWPSAGSSNSRRRSQGRSGPLAASSGVSAGARAT